MVVLAGSHGGFFVVTAAVCLVGDPWFAAKDVRDVLGIRTDAANAQLDPVEKAAVRLTEPLSAFPGWLDTR